MSARPPPPRPPPACPAGRLQRLRARPSLPAGPLFNFDVHDDVRLLSDATVEKDEVALLLAVVAAPWAGREVGAGAGP